VLKPSRLTILIFAAVAVAVFTIACLLIRSPAFPEAETIAVLPGTVSGMSWDEGHSILLTWQRDGIVTIWDFSDIPPESRTISLGQEFWVTSAALSRSNAYLAVGSESGSVVVWDLISDRLHYESLPYGRVINRIGWSSDNRFLAASDSGISVVDVETAAEIQRIEQWVASLSWIPESYLLVGKLATGTGGIEVWDAENGNIVKQFGYTSAPALLSPDGTRILANGVMDIETGQRISSCLECFVATLSFAWSHDSQQMAVGSGRFMCFEGSLYCVEDFNIRVWNVETDVLPMILSGHTDDVIALAWHPDDSEITSVSADNTARIWDAQTSTLLQTLYIGDRRYHGPVELKPDGSMLAVIYNDAVRVLDLTTSVEP